MNWCFQIVVLEKTLESPMDSKKIKPADPKGNQLWIFIGRTDAEAEAPILWPTDSKNWLIGKDPDAGKDWRKEKGTTEDEMVGWHHQLDGCEFAQTPGDRDGQGGLVCCRPWGHKESDTTERLNWPKSDALPICSPLSMLFAALSAGHKRWTVAVQACGVQHFIVCFTALRSWGSIQTYFGGIDKTDCKLNKILANWH